MLVVVAVVVVAIIFDYGLWLLWRWVFLWFQMWHFDTIPPLKIDPIIKRSGTRNAIPGNDRVGVLSFLEEVPEVIERHVQFEKNADPFKTHKYLL